MADDKAATSSLLMNLPLEVRHTIFEYGTARNTKPKKLLRYWFEKKEAKELIAQHVAAHPNGPAPHVVQDNEYEEDSDVPEEEDEEDQDGDDEDNEAEEDQDDDDEDELGDDEIDQDEQNNDSDSNVDDTEDVMEEGEDGPTQAQDMLQLLPSQTQAAVQAQPQEDDEEPHLGEDVAEAQNGVDEDGDETLAEEDGGEDADNEGDVEGTAVAPPPPPPAPVHVIRAARKWRYIPNFMRLTHCPPPVELLLASKQLNEEAKNWFYDVAILRINATGSFAHTSFFEEAFSQITEAAFSPMENIRKVEVTFVWDTTWLRADSTGSAEAIFPALLRQRSDFVNQILLQAPDLKEVTIHWHDSAQDNESAIFMLDILAPFHALNAIVKIEEHYIAADAKPHERSIAGKRRLEFQAIIDAGLERLF